MKNTIKSIFIGLFVLFLSLNINSTMQLSFGGEEVQARNIENEITCWSQTKFHLFKSTTHCATCSIKRFSTGDDGEGVCSN